MEKELNARRSMAMRIMQITIVVLIALGCTMTIVDEARANNGKFATGMPSETTLETTATTHAKAIRAAKKAYRNYLAKHPSSKHFRLVWISDDGLPVLLCTKQKIYDLLGPNFWFTADAFVYDSSKASKIRRIGTLTTGGTACQLHYAKGVVYGYRIAGLHTFTTVKVRNGRLSMSGMYDNQYSADLSLRHFSNFNPKTMGDLEKSHVLGKRGTQAQYNRLVEKYGKHPLKMFKNNRANRASRI